MPKRERNGVCVRYGASWRFMLLRSHLNQRHEKTIWQLRSRGNGGLEESRCTQNFSIFLFFLIFFRGKSLQGDARRKIGFFNVLGSWLENWDTTGDDVKVVRMNIDLGAKKTKQFCVFLCESSKSLFSSDASLSLLISVGLKSLQLTLINQFHWYMACIEVKNDQKLVKIE